MNTEPSVAPVETSDSGPREIKPCRSLNVKKAVVMYCTMVAVSTGAIYLLEHASLVSAFRTALVAAVGKTFAATWVSGLFD